jgi:Tfp pilus assembly protein PilZ
LYKRSVFKDVGLKKHLYRALPDVILMLNYIDATKNTYIKVKGNVVNKDGSIDEYVRLKPYIHRFHEIYRRGILAKFYQLDDWYKINQLPTTMATLTCRHNYSLDGRYIPDGYSILQSFKILKESWGKLRKVLSYYIPNLLYVWVIEPHQMGFPHYHVLIFNEIPPELEHKIRVLWSEKYGAGSYENGVDFEFEKPSENIKSVKNYMMKYLVKTISPDEMTPELLVFNAILWKHRYRLVGASAELSRVMARKDGKEDDFVWTETIFVDSDGNERTIRKARPDDGQ